MTRLIRDPSEFNVASFNARQQLDAFSIGGDALLFRVGNENDAFRLPSTTRFNPVESFVNDLMLVTEQLELRVSSLEADVEALQAALAEQTTAPPDEVALVANMLPLAGLEIRDAELTTPAPRLYGLSVTVSGLVSDDAVAVTLYGNSIRTDVQYEGAFSALMTSDLSQAWRYRDRSGGGKIYLRVRNKQATATQNIAVTIKAEPF